MPESLIELIENDIKALKRSRNIAQSFSVCADDSNLKRQYTICYRKLGVIIEARERQLRKARASAE